MTVALQLQARNASCVRAGRIVRVCMWLYLLFVAHMCPWRSWTWSCVLEFHDTPGMFKCGGFWRTTCYRHVRMHCSWSLSFRAACQHHSGVVEVLWQAVVSMLSVMRGFHVQCSFCRHAFSPGIRFERRCLHGVLMSPAEFWSASPAVGDAVVVHEAEPAGSRRSRRWRGGRVAFSWPCC